MKRSIKIIVITLCTIASILIVTGIILSVKEYISENELIFNVADENYYRIVFNLNGATSIEHKIVKCKINNNSCNVILPSATKKDGIVLGYSDDKNDTVAKYRIGDTLTLNNSIELYVISYKKNTLKIMKNNVDYLEKEEISCNAYNKAIDCSVIMPNFNKVGYENKGYSTVKDSLMGFKFPSDEYKISNDVILYPIYSTSSRHKVINIAKTFTYKDSFIEVEKGCSEKVYQEYLKYLDGISKQAPFLLLGNKIAFVTDKSFDDIWGVTYVGMNYGPKSLRSVDIRCSKDTYNDYYATMVHEMAHSWDFYYAMKLGNNISSQSDIINLYNKYKGKDDRPFRDYSYSNIYEFIADMMRYYYFKYNVPKEGYSNLIYPSDIKKALEKYICISKNNYDESKCK